MQFHLRTLLLMVTIAAVVCGTLVAPPWLAVPSLGLILWVSPAFWLSQAFWSRGRKQAFFVGASLAGISPYLAAVILSILYYAEWVDDGDWPRILDQPDNRWAAMRVAIAVYLPGVCSLIGGGLGLLAWQQREKGAAWPQDAGPNQDEAGGERNA